MAVYSPFDAAAAPLSKLTNIQFQPRPQSVRAKETARTIPGLCPLIPTKGSVPGPHSRLPSPRPMTSFVPAKRLNSAILLVRTNPSIEMPKSEMSQTDEYYTITTSTFWYKLMRCTKCLPCCIVHCWSCCWYWTRLIWYSCHCFCCCHWAACICSAVSLFFSSASAANFWINIPRTIFTQINTHVRHFTAIFDLLPFLFCTNFHVISTWMHLILQKLTHACTVKRTKSTW